MKYARSLKFCSPLNFNEKDLAINKEFRKISEYAEGRSRTVMGVKPARFMPGELAQHC